MPQHFEVERVVNPARVLPLNNNQEFRPGPVIYWMIRDKRVQNNWALLHARQKAKELGQPFGVAYCYGEFIPEFSLRQIDFMLQGLEEVGKELKKLNIPFILLKGKPEAKVPAYCNKFKVGTLVTDFFPLKSVMTAQRAVARKLDVPFHCIDAHNIVPCWHASDKQEYAARTFRPKVTKKLKAFLTKFPRVTQQESAPRIGQTAVSWKALRAYKGKKVDKKAAPISWLPPGPAGAKKVFATFLKSKIKNYAELRNNPTHEALSNLSPYFHFGFISAQHVALETYNKVGATKSRASFLEEMIVRRELSDNFCFYAKKYDSLEACPDWARKTLARHAKDKREYLYSKKQFEDAKTHDPLWNAAQNEMVVTGKMHGYMRMYWAKKILEWTKTPEYAVKVALELNDSYELDGCDPNGYVGVLWSIGGLHDRAWFKRPIFGSIRYMSYNGAASKFDVEGYIKKIEKLSKK